MAFDVFGVVGNEVENKSEDDDITIKVDKVYEERIKIPDLKNEQFKIGDAITIPMLIDKTVFEFCVYRVVYIDNKSGRVYFLSDVVLGVCTMKTIDRHLDSILEMFPKGIVDCMETIHHRNMRNNDQIDVTNRKLTIPSYKNLFLATKRSSRPENDQYFDSLLKPYKKRRLNHGMDCGWWTDTACANSNEYYYVSSNGQCGTMDGDAICGVVPMFCIKSDACICEDKEGYFQ